MDKKALSWNNARNGPFPENARVARIMTKTSGPHGTATGMEPCATPEAAVDRLCLLYDEAITAIAAAFTAFSRGETPPAGAHPTYPYLSIEVSPGAISSTTLAFGKVTKPGRYGTTITAPALFRDYLTEQLRLLADNYKARLYVGKSHDTIPLTFAVEKAAAAMDAQSRRAVAEHFPMPRLDTGHDAIVDGARWDGPGPAPLSLFSAERIDFSLHRLRHYTGTEAPHFQGFVLFTNYQRYIDEFQAYAAREVEAGRALRFVEPGNRITEKGRAPSRPPLAKLPQMPAYHLVQENGQGVTLINIGVGPSNAKTLTDHLAVLRPHVWLMIGHCGGLRASQRLGDYVLAHAYLRDDQVLDEMLPTAIPIPALAEVQVALAQAVAEITGVTGQTLK